MLFEPGSESRNMSVNNSSDNRNFDLKEEVISVRRVTKVVKGGRRLGISAFVVVGDASGRVGLGIGKSKEMAGAVSKASRRAKRGMVSVPLHGSTLPYSVTGKSGASKVILRAASKGTGVIAGGAVRSVMNALGVQDVLAKSVGSGNPIGVAHAVMDALSKLQSSSKIVQSRGRSISEILSAGN